ncbi:MAG: hypothetical protein ACK59A_01885, partial [Cyanobacteriota bacterium]
MTMPPVQESPGQTGDPTPSRMTQASWKTPTESEATRLYHAAQITFEPYNYIATDLNARIEKEKREHHASSFRKNVVLLALTILCLASGSASLFLLFSSNDDQ